MRLKIVLVSFVLLLILLPLVTACGEQQLVHPSPTLGITATPSATPTLTPTFTATYVPTASPTFTPIPITNKNVTDLIPIAQYNMIVRDIRYSPDGKWLFVAEEGGFRVFDTSNLALPPKFLGMNIARPIIAFSPNGNLLAIADESESSLIPHDTNASIFLWDTATWKPIKTIRVKKLNGLSWHDLVFLSNNVLVAQETGYTWIINVDTGEPIKTLGSYDVISVAVSPDKKIIAAGTWDWKIKLWDAITFQEISTFWVDQLAVSYLEFSPDGTMLVSTAFNSEWKEGKLSLWDVATGRKIRGIRSSDRLENAIFSPDGSKLAVCCNDQGQTITFNPDTGKIINESIFGGNMDFAPDGKILTVGSGHSVYFWDTNSYQLVAKMNDSSPDKERSYGGNGIILSPNGNMFFSYDRNERNILVIVRDTLTGNPIHTLDVDFYFNNTYLYNTLYMPRFSPDSSILAVTVGDNLAFWDTTTWEMINSFPNIGLFSYGINPDNKLFISSSESITLWDIDSGQQVDIIECGESEDFCGSPVFSPDGKTFSVVRNSKEPEIVIFDAVTGGQLSTVNGHDNIFRNNIIYSPNGKILASTQNAGSCSTILLDVFTGNQIRKLEGFCDPIVFLPESKFMLAYSDRGITSGHVVVLDIETGEVIQQFPQMGELAFLYNGSVLVSGDPGVIIRYWGLEENQSRYPEPIAPVFLTLTP